LLWATCFALALAGGLVVRPVLGPALLGGPVVGLALFVLLAGDLPHLPRRPKEIVLVRGAYLLAAAAFEELVWRGLVLGTLSPRLGWPAALVLSSVAFALWHHRMLGRRSAVHLATGAGFGVAFLSGGLVSAILAHAVYNELVDLRVLSCAGRGGRR
jgi:membrane protease YdiL (CAAX protease family)